MRDFHVVILSKNKNNLERCLQGIFENEPGLDPRRIILVNDGIEDLADRITVVQGERPFVYARNANIGIRRAKTDVILLNDDAFLETPGGFTRMAEIMEERPEIGLLSAAVRGVVCNPLQRDDGTKNLRQIPNNAAFVAVYIPRRTYASIGYLDERFVGYGYDDNDYCYRLACSGGGVLACTNECVVDHGGQSSFRSSPEWQGKYSVNRSLYVQKWNGDPDYGRVVDIMFLAFNRLEFTKKSFESLVENTDWFYVNELWAYDDGSTDGTYEFLKGAIENVPVQRKLICLDPPSGGPVGPMRDFVGRATSPYLAKIDNDTVLAPGWLETALGVMVVHPELGLLGIEPHEVPIDPDLEIERGYREVMAIGGLGLFRSSAFIDSLPDIEGTYYGFWNWQIRNKRLRKGFMRPGLPTFLLDRVPEDPWSWLSKQYIDRGWQRPWGNYAPEQKELWKTLSPAA